MLDLTTRGTSGGQVIHNSLSSKQFLLIAIICFTCYIPRVDWKVLKVRNSAIIIHQHKEHHRVNKSIWNGYANIINRKRKWESYSGPIIHPPYRTWASSISLYYIICITGSVWEDTHIVPSVWGIYNFPSQQLHFSIRTLSSLFYSSLISSPNLWLLF